MKVWKGTLLEMHKETLNCNCQDRKSAVLVLAWAGGVSLWSYQLQNEDRQAGDVLPGRQEAEMQGSVNAGRTLLKAEWRTKKVFYELRPSIHSANPT